MKKAVNSIISVIAVLCLCGAVFAGCADSKKADSVGPALSDCGIIHEPEFGGVYIKMTIEDFNTLGFEYGDSVDVSFSNGYTLSDIPYYNGYYVETGKPLLVAYPGYDYIKACINNGDDLWTVAKLGESDTASVTLNQSAKYKSIQNARDIHYTDNRDDYASDEIFANFRSIGVSTIKENNVYRSASPCDNQHGRASYVDSLMEKAGVKFIVNLSDDDEKIKGYISADGFNSPYFLSLYKVEKVIPIALNMNFASDEFKNKVAKGLTAMAENEGPYLVHCTEGKDRTGFVCMLLEALSGAPYQEIVDDYMITYFNYYGIDEKSDNERYTVIIESVLNPMIQSMTGDENADIKTADLSEYAEAFLISGGMTKSRINELKAKIVK